MLEHAESALAANSSNKVTAKRVLRTALVLFACVLIEIAGANAQMTTGTLVGQVNDPGEKGVPKADITVTNAGTGIPTDGITSSTGFYSISGLLPGTYSVTIKAPGFSAFAQNGIVLHSAETVRVNATLQVGSMQQTVEVTGGAPLIRTDSATLGTTLNMHQIRTLPSATQGIGALLTTVPGATDAGPSAWYSQPQISGATHWGASNFLVDGVSTDDITEGGGAYSWQASGGDAGRQTTVINQPPIDTLQEFRVLSVNSNAEFGSPATIIMVTKSGTNKFHGDLYEFFQNAALNANTYQLNATGQPRAKANLNQFGGSIGGPIWRNKAFFFFAPSYFRQINAGLAQLTLPSAAMDKGDFSALESEGTQLYNPLTGQPFPNNQIPSSMIAPQAAALLKYLPTPTVADSPGLPSGPSNYFKSVSTHDYESNYTLRDDYQIVSSDRLFGVYRQSSASPWNVFLGGPPQYGNGSNYGFRDKTMTVGETHIFSPTALNDFRAFWFRHMTFRHGQNAGFNPSSLFPQLTPGGNRGLPTMAASGYSTLVHDIGNTGLYGTVNTIGFSDTLTKVIGNHSFKAGFDETGYKSYPNIGQGSLGSFSFSGRWTGNTGWPGQPKSQGNAFADFLLGDANSATRSSVNVPLANYNRILGAFAQDSWQATPHLTLTYGIRYMYQSAWNIEDNARSFFDVANNKIALPENSVTPTLPRLGNATFFNAYLPYFETTQSIGLPTHYMKPGKNNWQPRIGFAYRFWHNTVLRGGYGIYYNFLFADLGNWGSGNLPFGSTAETASSELPGKPTTPYLPDITFASPFANPTASLSLHPGVRSEQRNLKNAMVQQFSLTVEHQFGQNWMARASYIGSVTHQLPWFEMDINQPIAQIPNTPYQNQRPLQPWGEINSIRGGAVQNFNQLQLEAKRRYSNGISVDINYSWTRSLDDENFVGGPQQFRFPQLDYGNSEQARTNSLTADYLYALPFGRGRRFLENASGVINGVVGGWQVSGITNYSSGDPLSVNFAVPPGFIGWEGGRADRVPGIPVYIRNHGHNVIQGVPWINPKAFAPPQPWTWGTSARNSVWGPGLVNWDMSALKHVSAPGNRFDVTLRADFFDAFNHFNPGDPNTTIPATQYGGLPIATSGEITGGDGNRVIQLSLRTSF